MVFTLSFFGQGISELHFSCLCRNAKGSKSLLLSTELCERRQKCPGMSIMKLNLSTMEDWSRKHFYGSSNFIKTPMQKWCEISKPLSLLQAHAIVKIASKIYFFVLLFTTLCQLILGQPLWILVCFDKKGLLTALSPYCSALLLLPTHYFPQNLGTVFPHINAAATILFWIHKSLKISYSFLIKFSLM